MSLTISNQPQVQQTTNPEKPEKIVSFPGNETLGWALCPALMIGIDVINTGSEIVDRSVEKHNELVEEYGTVGVMLMGGGIMETRLATVEVVAEKAVEIYQEAKNGLEKACDWVKNLF